MCLLTQVVYLKLEMDTEDMAKRSATWFQFKGIDAMKPTSLAGLSYDTNSSNQKTTAASDSIIQSSRLNFIFNYGERPGSSTIANLLYQPSYLMNIAGSGVNEFEQRNHVSTWTRIPSQCNSHEQSDHNNGGTIARTTGT